MPAIYQTANGGPLNDQTCWVEELRI